MDEDRSLVYKNIGLSRLDGLGATDIGGTCPAFECLDWLEVSNLKLRA